MGPMSIPLAEQIHIPHQCFFLFFSFVVMEAEGMFNHKVDWPDFSLANPKQLCFCTGHCGDQSKVKSLFISHLNFQLTYIIVLDVYSHCYEVELPISEHIPIIKHFPICYSFLNHIEHFLCHWTCKLKGYKCVAQEEDEW
jgi:hypothetical protein